MLCNLYRNYIFNSEFLKNDPSSASEEDYSQFENIEIKDETYDNRKISSVERRRIN